MKQEPDILTKPQNSSPALSGRTAGQVMHLALIPDGNRRWASKHGLASSEGHRKGFLEVFPALLEHAWNHDVHTVTLWMFSTDNWNRTAEEIQHLMDIYHHCLLKVQKLARLYEAQVQQLGRKDRIPAFLRQELEELEQETAAYTQRKLFLALDYSGRDELLQAVNTWIQQNPGQAIPGTETLSKLLGTGNSSYPEPDLIIRSSGELRSSGFMPWQSIYSEYFFVPKYFPELLTEDLSQALEAYTERNRRYGR